MPDINETRTGERFSIDTTFILFFLGIEVGQTIFSPDAGLLIASVTLLMVAFLPYFIPTFDEKPAFGIWAAGRGTIAMLAVLIGVGFHSVQGTILPAELRSVPLVLLIVSGMISFYVQFWSLLRFRLAK